MRDTIYRDDAIRVASGYCHPSNIAKELERLSSAQFDHVYTKRELKVFRSCISLRLLSLRSAQLWKHDDETASEIEFLNHLYEKVGADMEAEHDS